MSMTLNNPVNAGAQGSGNYATNQGNPFRRQKQQAKHQQKYS